MNNTTPVPSPARFAPTGTGLYALFTAVMAVVLILSNLGASKGVTFGPIVTYGGFFLFPLAGTPSAEAVPWFGAAGQDRPMDLLILGGTRQLGRQVTAVAVAAGHSVTCLARGTSPVPDGAHFVRADRDEPGALDPVRGRRWDAVVELATAPGRVRRAVREIDAGHWIYVSSVSVYRDHSNPHRIEDAPLHAPLSGDVLAGPEDYGPAKAASELAVSAAARVDDRDGGRNVTIIRPGLIGGAEDDTGRSGYYPWRFRHPSGPDVIVPDDPSFPVAVIDVNDLAAWMVRCAKRRLHGVFNATGATTSLAEVLETSRRVAGQNLDNCRRTARSAEPPEVVPPRPAPAEVLESQGIAPWMGPDSLPLWIPDPGLRYASTADSSRAVRAGLALRPLRETLQDALAFEQSRGGPVGAGLSDEAEERVRRSLPSG